MIFVYGVCFLLLNLFVLLPIGLTILKILKAVFGQTGYFAVSLLIGFWLLGNEYFLLGFFNLRAIYFYFVIIQSLLLVFYNRKYYSKILQHIRLNFKSFFVNRTNILIVITIGICIILNSTITIGFGGLNKDGLRLSGAHYIDSTFQIGLINNVIRKIPPENPIFAGVSLSDYHYLTNVHLAAIEEITKIPTEQLYFNFIGPYLIFFLTVFLFLLSKKISSSNFVGLFSVLFVTFSSNLYYLVPFIYSNASSRVSVMWVDFFSTKMVNYQLLYSLIIVLAFMLLILSIERFNLKSKIILGTILGSLILIKSQTALVVVPAFMFTAAVVYFRLKSANYLFISFIGAIVSFIIWFLLLKGSQQVLLYQPFFLIETMYQSSEHLNHPVWELQRQYLLSVNGWRGIFKLYAQGILLFLLINLGPSILSYFGIFKKKILTDLNFIFLITCSLVGILLSLTFVTIGNAWDTVQFFYISVFALGFLYPVVVYKILGKFIPTARMIIIISWLILIPGAWFTINQYWEGKNVINYDNNIVAALQFLRSQPYGVVLADEKYNDNSIIPAYANKPLFWSTNLVLSRVDSNIYQDRENTTKNLINCKEESSANIDIKYLFISRDNDCWKVKNMQPLYINDKVVIYKFPNS